MTTLQGDYEPSPSDWVRDQVAEYEASGGQKANTLLDTGAPEHPEWFYNLEAHPDEVLVQDGPAPVAVAVREVSGAEKATWWERAVAAYPPYAEYQEKTDRQIPVFVTTPKGA
jgi:deazaflavin-dependent oxidoreductase (nitroreductase family)